jgi:hypothetical protein
MAGEKHKNAKTWEKGKSGNPGGRSPKVGPNGETIVQLCRAHTADLIKRAYEIAMDKATDPKDALTAIFGICDRGWGKPTESIEMDMQADVRGNFPVINLTVTRPGDNGA